MRSWAVAEDGDPPRSAWSSVQAEGAHLNGFPKDREQKSIEVIAGCIRGGRVGEGPVGTLVAWEHKSRRGRESTHLRRPRERARRRRKPSRGWGARGRISCIGPSLDPATLADQLQTNSHLHVRKPHMSSGGSTPRLILPGVHWYDVALARSNFWGVLIWSAFSPGSLTPQDLLFDSTHRVALPDSDCRILHFNRGRLPSSANKYASKALSARIDSGELIGHLRDAEPSSQIRYLQFIQLLINVIVCRSMQLSKRSLNADARAPMRYRAFLSALECAFYSRN
ncbi:hypothetical protein C8R44DRAFT_724926 [Mycena epipterygia]|nr:hypothetical protein C8R44DRAFT_724926 [Mycena epipterygia]